MANNSFYFQTLILKVEIYRYLFSKNGYIKVTIFTLNRSEFEIYNNGTYDVGDRNVEICIQFVSLSKINS